MNEEAPGGIVFHSRENGAPAIEVHLNGEPVWRLTQQQLAEFFQTSGTNVVEHIRHIHEALARASRPPDRRDGSADAQRRRLREPSASDGEGGGEYEKYRALADSSPSDVERSYLDAVKRAQRRVEGGDRREPHRRAGRGSMSGRSAVPLTEGCRALAGWRYAVQAQL